MRSARTIYILGSGAIGFPLAAHLTRAGRRVLAVRTSRDDVLRSAVMITTYDRGRPISTPVETISLSELRQIDGIIVIASKSYANQAIARALRDRAALGPIVIMQNGVGVEQPFLDAQFPTIYRCILYITGQTRAEYTYSAHAVAPSPIGIICGDEAELQRCVADLSTADTPFRAEADIQREIWKKAIINCVFNSICPLLDTDNGVFARDAAAAALARELIAECVALTARLGIGLDARELSERIIFLSTQSAGQLASTLQDIRGGRQTEIASLNLEIARIAAALQPPLDLPRVALLGKLIAVISAQQAHVPPPAEAGMPPARHDD
ncbi:2-dehydropantoate 2-reductase [Oscillochloris sp. ZM17-4]|uniref:ketopantoate reductase family protein n=1 Tax=Oscillochloris sp. ZM17-4 TaxID=2866714 RepID=UPI001C737893|nr:2-dehydropantoate 2-reductase [Oscillochloris sp. ZM17-4]MBX0330812.1 2-dehydropantoate 2-reductase [Oscillochloris sp. ZM17-4]